MRPIFQTALLLIYVTISDSSLYTDVKDKLASHLKYSLGNLNLIHNSLRDEETERSEYSKNDRDRSRFQIKHNRDRGAQGPRFKEFNDRPRLRHGKDSANATIKEERMQTNQFKMDPVLNNIRRNARSFDSLSSETTDSSSSSLELKFWKDEWREHWINKKIEAINSSVPPKGDEINMVAARPWGVPCGDPDQHDIPWGSCMLAMECDAEYRIYRGDYFCGRSQFVCCAIQHTNYDMYQGFDVSFQDSGLSTSSEEKRNRGRSSKEKRRRRRQREKRRRKKNRLKRKKKIKKIIRKIIRHMRKILNRSYKNGTKSRKRKTKQLKKFIKDLKKKYRQDRNVVSVIHDDEMIKIDEALMKKLLQINAVNEDFIRNSTFRDIVVNGTINKKGARMLVQAYPDLAIHFMDKTRRSDSRKPKDYLDYDIEYGMLYY